MTTRNRTRTVLTLAAVVLSICAMATSASAGILVHEPFAYADGWLTGLGGALGTTGTWTANDTHSGDWRIHQEGDTTGIVVAPGPPVVRNMFDGTVANLLTSGGYVGLPGPADTGADPDLDHEIGRYLDASIALDPSVTATFQSGTTTWFSYLAVQAWDRNEETPNLTIGTDPSPNNSRGASLTNSGSGIGTGGGPPRNDRGDIYPMYFDGGNPHNLNGAWNGSWSNDAWGTPDDGRMVWVESDADGFGAANIVVGKIEWDADTGGEDIISVVRFLETDTLDEAAFDALITAQPNLSSANWAVAANKPDLDQSQFDLINIAGCKYFVDEIRIGTTFDDVMGTAVDPNAPEVDAGGDWITWSGEPVTANATVDNNDPDEPQADLTYAWTVDAASLADANLTIEITNADQEDVTVEITKTADTGDATVVTMTLAANNVGSGKPAVEDTMTIDVYDDSCKAANADGTLEYDPADFDANCITDLRDYAVLAAAWLVDYTLTEPVAQ